MRNCFTFLLILIPFLVNGQGDIRLTKKGISLGKNGNYVKAIQCFDQALKLNPRNLNALYYKGYALEKMEQYNEAPEYYSKALEIRHEGSIIYRRGYCYFRNKQDSLAIIDFTEALRLLPENQEILMMRASAYLRSKKYQELLKDLDAHLEKVPLDYFSQGNKAMALIALGRYDEGITLARHLIVERPKEALLYNILADAYMRLERYEEALVEINKTLAISPKYDIGHLTKAQILVRQNKVNEACEELNLSKKYGADLNELDEKDKNLFKQCI